MTDRQFDLFSDTARTGPESRPAQTLRQAVVPADMEDAQLIAAIPEAGIADAALLAAEAGRRRLDAAIPALAALCRRFTGFGAERIVSEQAAALRALAAIGGAEAAQAVSKMISQSVMQGPTLVVAVTAAAQLQATLPTDTLRSLLQHADPAVRAAACGCARRVPEILAILVNLLGDRDQTVVISSACALGRLGRIEARRVLKPLLRERPSKEIIESVSTVADKECMALLGQIARNAPNLAGAALEALDSIDDPHASSIAAKSRQVSPVPAGAVPG